MHSFISELRAEGVTYVAPWRPVPQLEVPSSAGTSALPSGDGQVPAQTSAEGAVGYDLATTSSDFGSMSLEEAVTLERARK